MTFIEVLDDKSDCVQLNIKAIKTFSTTTVSNKPHDPRFPIDLGDLDVVVDIVAVDGSKYTHSGLLAYFCVDVDVDFKDHLGDYKIAD